MAVTKKSASQKNAKAAPKRSAAAKSAPLIGSGRGLDALMAIQNVARPVQNSETVRIDDIEPLSCSLNLYPNPTTKSFTLECDETVSPLHYSLYTLSGQLLHEGTFQQQTSVNVSSLPSGHYMLRVEDKEKNQSNVYKVIKIR